MRKPSYAKQLVEAKTGRTIEAVLRDLYVDRGYSFVEIGKALGVSREAVRLWVEEYGLRDERPGAAEAIA